MKFVILLPALRLEGTFYELVLQVMQAAAARLGVELQIRVETSPQNIIERAKEIAASRPAPDCVLFPNHKSVAHEILPLLDTAGIPSFLVFEGLTPTDLVASGQPRTRLRHWIGQLYSDDIAVGRLLAEQLVDQAVARKLVDTDGRIRVGVIAGDQTFAGQLRYQGWLAFKKARPEVVQAGVQYANWVESTARAATDQLLRSHPEIKVLWVANDAMAFGVIDAVRSSGRRPGQDVLIGAVDLMPRALQSICDGEMAVTLGGHFLDGARSLILSYDYLNGRDFEPHTQRSMLEAVTAHDARRHLRFFEREAWRDVEYERFSRAKAGSDQVPELSLGSLLREWRAGSAS